MALNSLNDKGSGRSEIWQRALIARTGLHQLCAAAKSVQELRAEPFDKKNKHYTAIYKYFYFQKYQITYIQV